MNIAVAIDGPVGAGKSSIARQAAKKLDFIYVDTGAMYRGIGLYTVRKGVGTKDTGAVISLLPEIELDIKIIDGTQRVFLNGEDVSEDIRLPEISMAASDVSAIPEVRAFLLDLQRGFAKTNNVIMDGRDIGTVILPDAEVKIYLTADAEVRAKRRYDELIAKGKDVKYEDVLADLNQRDYNDMHREIAPLKVADDAVIADTTELDFEQSCELIAKIIKEKAGI
ncbi:MAG: (d)CMP kinase [Ruminiclostridium sp.]|nr:(d)CMP kinase [Ruminiclostridium sp.]